MMIHNIILKRKRNQWYPRKGSGAAQLEHCKKLLVDP